MCFCILVIIRKAILWPKGLFVKAYNVYCTFYNFLSGAGGQEIVTLNPLIFLLLPGELSKDSTKNLWRQRTLLKISTWNNNLFYVIKIVVNKVENELFSTPRFNSLLEYMGHNMM